MSKMKYIGLSIISFVLLTIIQLNIINKVNIFGVIPNLFVIYIAYINILNEDNIFTSIISLFIGIFFDICFGTVIGVYALISLTISLVTPIICKGVSVETKMGMIVYSIAITIIWETMFGIIYLAINNATFCVFNILLIVLVTTVINVIVVICLHGFFKKYLQDRSNELKLIRKY